MEVLLSVSLPYSCSMNIVVAVSTESKNLLGFLIPLKPEIRVVTSEIVLFTSSFKSGLNNTMKFICPRAGTFPALSQQGVCTKRLQSKGTGQCRGVAVTQDILCTHYKQELIGSEQPGVSPDLPIAATALPPGWDVPASVQCQNNCTCSTHLHSSVFSSLLSCLRFLCIFFFFMRPL